MARYCDVVAGSLSEVACAILEQEMSEFYYEYQHRWLRGAQQKGIRQGRKEGREEGRTEGKAEALLEVLAARGIAVPAAEAEQIRKAGADQLRRWLQRAVTAHSIDELFD